MPTTFDDPIVREKDVTHKALPEKAGGDLKKHTGIVHRTAEKAREKHPGGFYTVPNKSSLAV